MRKMLITLVLLAGCSSESGGGGQATTKFDPDVIVAGLSHGVYGVTVFKHEWLATGDCRSTRGDITAAEIEVLKGYMSDETIQGLGKECGESEYRLTIGQNSSVCWLEGQSSKGIDGLMAFFKDKIDKLSTVPQGKCGGVQDVGESNWAKEKMAAAGSGG
jgi:hypothetical protein